MIAALAMLVASVVTGTALAVDDGTSTDAGAEVYSASVSLGDDAGSVDVSVSVPDGAFDVDVTLEAGLVEDSDAVADTLDGADLDYDGMLALDVRFVDVDGNEVEPAEPVEVSFDLPASSLGDDVDASSIAVSHLSEDADGNVESVDTVADAGDESDGTIAVDGDTEVSSDTDVSAAETVTAEFTVESFSTFTIRWGNNNNNSLTVHIIDTDGSEISTSNIGTVNINSATTITEIRSDINESSILSGYTFVKAVVANNANSAVRDNATRVQRIQYASGDRGGGNWQYNTSGSGNAWRNFGNGNTLYLVYEENAASDDDTSTVSTTVTTGKTAELRGDGDYDLTLTISGTRGSETTPAMVDVLFIVDRSNSMTNNGSQRLANAQTAMNTLVNSLEGNSNIDARYSIVTFSSSERGGSKNDASVHMNWTSVNGNNVSTSINSITSTGGTDYQAGLEVGADQLESTRVGAITVVIFLSDGDPTYAYGYGNGGNSLDRTQTERPNSTYQGWVNTLTQASRISCDYFYAVGIGSSSKDYLEDVANAVNATTAAYIEAESDGSNLTNLFTDIVASVTFFAARDVTVTDELSDYADMVLDEDDDPQFTITVTDGETTWTSTESKSSLTFKSADGGDITVMANYDATSKTITLDFPDEYELESGYTYSVSTVIAPSAMAETTVSEGGAYNATGDSNTGTYSGLSGFYSNAEAKVSYYDVAAEESDSADFPKPVIQVPVTVADLGEPEHDKTITSCDGDDCTFDLNLSVTGASNSAESSGVQRMVDIVFVLDKSGSMDYRLDAESTASGNQRSRMDLLQDAVDSLVDTVEENSGIDARYAAVGFSDHGSTTTQDWTDSSTTITNYVNNLKPNGGTNYQRAIYEAKQLLNSARDGAVTFVIFVSDGIPTYRGTSSDSGTGSSDPNGYNIDAAVSEISTMSCDYFYAIGMGPSFTSNSTGMTNLTKLANAVQASSGTGVYSATDTDDLEAAFAAISDVVASVTMSNGYGRIVITDTLSNYLELTNPDGNGLPTDYKLTVTDAEGNAVTTEDVDVNVSWNDDKTSFVFTFDPTDYVLVAGYTYTVSYGVKPVQGAFNVNAVELPANEKATLDYSTVVTTNGEKVWTKEDQITYEVPTFTVPESTLTITKVWSGGEPTDASSVVVSVYQDGDEEAYATVKLTKGEDGVWSSAKVSVPAGPEGHAYTVAETAAYTSDGERITGWSPYYGYAVGSTTSGSKVLMNGDGDQTGVELVGLCAQSATITITNTPNSYTYGIDDHLGLSKVLEGGTLQSGEYTFKLELVSTSNGECSGSNDCGIAMPDVTEVSNGDADGSGSVEEDETDSSAFGFGEIVFTMPGTYVVKVSEVVPDSSNSNVVYDEHVLYVRYVIGDDMQMTRYIAYVEAGVDAPEASSNDGWTQADVGDRLSGDAAGWLVWTNKLVVTSLPMTGGDTTLRMVLLVGGVLVLLAAGAWLLSRRRTV